MIDSFYTISNTKILKKVDILLFLIFIFPKNCYFFDLQKKRQRA
jgi:hypothetical protein